MFIFMFSYVYVYIYLAYNYIVTVYLDFSFFIQHRKFFVFIHGYVYEQFVRSITRGVEIVKKSLVFATLFREIQTIRCLTNRLKPQQ